MDVDEAYYLDFQLTSDPIKGVNIPVEALAIDVLATSGKVIYTDDASRHVTGNVVQPKDKNSCDATVRVEVRGKPESAGYALSGSLYTGATLQGEIQLLVKDQKIASKQFMGRVEPPKSVVADPHFSPSTPAKAPFQGAMRAPGGFLGALFVFLGDNFGYDFLRKMHHVVPFISRDNVAAGVYDVKSKHAVGLLLEHLRADKETEFLVVPAAAARALGETGEACVVEPLIEALEKWEGFGASQTGTRYGIRLEAIRALGRLGTPRAIEKLNDVVQDDDWQEGLRQAAREALAAQRK